MNGEFMCSKTHLLRVPPNVRETDDDCPFVEQSNVHGRAMLVAHTGAVSLPGDKQWKTQTKEKMKT